MRHKPLLDEEFRVTSGPLRSEESDGIVGAFLVPVESLNVLDRNKTLNQRGHVLQVISHDGTNTDWEHVSVMVTHRQTKETYTPIWQQMAVIKRAFWKEDERVLQYHPKKSEYVNVHKDVLHLFRPLDTEVPSPPTELLAPTRTRSQR